MSDNTKCQVDKMTESQNEFSVSWNLLPAELLTKIFNYLTIMDKRKARRVSKFWLNVIDSHPSMTFKVKLSDTTFKYVENIKWKSIESFSTEDLKREFDFFEELDEIPTIRVLTMGKGNSEENFWNALQYCDAFKVEHLELSNNSIQDFPTILFNGFPPKPLEITLTTIKTLTLTAYAKTEIIEPGETRHCFYTPFLERIAQLLPVLTFPSLENVSLDFSFEFGEFTEIPNHLSQVYQFLGRHKSISTITWKNRMSDVIFYPNIQQELDESSPNIRLEKLELDLDFRHISSVSPLIQSNHMLKHLFITQDNYLVPLTFDAKGYEVLEGLVHRNCATLETLSIKSYIINFGNLRLHECTSLKVLELSCSVLRNADIPQNLELLKLRSLTLVVKLDMHLAVIKSILRLTESRLEELTLDFYDGFDILELKNILLLSKIRKFILTGVDCIPPLILRYCCRANGISGSWVYDQNMYSKNYCILKSELPEEGWSRKPRYSVLEQVKHNSNT